MKKSRLKLLVLTGVIASAVLLLSVGYLLLRNPRLANKLNRVWVVEGHVLSERGTPISDVALKVTYQIGSYGITRALEGGKQETEHDVLRPDTNAFFSLRKQCSLVIIQVDDSRYQIAGPKNEAPDIWFCEFLVTPDNPLIHNRSDKDLKIILKNRVGEVQNGGSVP
jgi:hypothetical protein